MIDRERAEQLLAERRARKEREAAGGDLRSLVARIRAFFHAKQAGFFRSRHRRRATRKTRRSGATSGGCSELVARAIETPNFRAVYATSTRIDAERRAWINDTQSGFVDIIRKHGTTIDGGIESYDLGGVHVEVRTGKLQLAFSNGSLIELFGADDEGAVNRLRGLTKHVWWIDEAQDFIWLERLYKSVIQAGSTDFGGEVWLTGTPNRDCTGFFYEVTRSDGEALPGWEVHTIAVTDNPFFGRAMWQDGQWFVVGRAGIDDPVGPFESETAADEAAVRLRWERTAGAAIEENKWDPDDPDLLREWYGRWVKEDARYVYEVHRVGNERDLIYAPRRFAEDGFPDIRSAVLDLPGWREGRTYYLACGADLGTTRAFAWSLVGWSLVDPCLYEVASFKRPGLDYDEMAQMLRMVAAQATVCLWVADAGGGGKPAVAGWSKKWVERYQLPITEAEKQNKRMAIKQVNTDMRRRELMFRDGSPILDEWRTHRWSRLRGAAEDLPDSLEEDPRSHRDLSDAYLYIHRHSYHHRYREPDAKVLPGTQEWMLREEKEYEDAAIAEIEGPYGHR